MYKTLTLPLLVTLFLHGIMLALIVIGAPEAEPLEQKKPVKYIEAKLVKLEEPQATPKPEADDNAQQRAKQAEQARLRQQREQAAREKAAREKAAEEAAKQQAAKEKARREKLKQERQAKQREQERIAEQQQRIREQQQRELDELIQQEKAARQAESDAELANSYIAVISRVIENNWDRPPSARKDMEVELVLQLVPTGEVVGVKVAKSSGNAAFDRSAEQAVMRAGRFPELQDLPPRVFEKYFRRLYLRFRPEDLRL